LPLPSFQNFQENGHLIWLPFLEEDFLSSAAPQEYFPPADIHNQAVHHLLFSLLIPALMKLLKDKWAVSVRRFSPL